MSSKKGKLSEYNLENKKKFEKSMKKAAENGLSSFEYQSKTFEITVFGNCIQTLIDNRFLYRILVKNDNNSSTVRDNLVNF
ncbi:MAG: hypothetical protein Q8900_05865 [Bacillota bacterium]|nr:hypothetical protein [Bacillota bacterium]